MNKLASRLLCLDLSKVVAAATLSLISFPVVASAKPDGLSDRWGAFIRQHCTDCHDAETRKGGLNLEGLSFDVRDWESFRLWVKIHDRIESGEMPPKKRARPGADDRKAVTAWLANSLTNAERIRLEAGVRTGVRRLTRSEYQNTIRDLLDLPGIPLKDSLPADGKAHGFDNNSDALDMSHVQMAKYIEAADFALNEAIATQPEPPRCEKHTLSLAGPLYTNLVGGDVVLLKEHRIDTVFPPAGEMFHVGQAAHSLLANDRGRQGLSVGVFRAENESFRPAFRGFAAVHAGRYRMRASLWSFLWDKGQVLPGRGTEAARLDVVHLLGDGRGGDHPSDLIGYFDAPSLTPQIHQIELWLNPKDTIGFDVASLAPVALYNRGGRAMGYTGPGIANDWLEIEGPIHEVWPPRSHQLLFGKLPIKEFKPEEQGGIRSPLREVRRQKAIGAKNRPEPFKGTWTVQSEAPLADADRLLQDFLPKAFRRGVDASVRQEYLTQVEARLKAGDCFESAMRSAYRLALCSPDFLYHIEPVGRLDEYALASRLSYFLWNSMPDEALYQLAAAGKLRDLGALDDQIERLLKDSRSWRFVEDFLGQWLKLSEISATDPDSKLYPESSKYLVDSMVAETRAYFRELIDQNLPVSYLVKSDFAMLNEKLATHYGIAGVRGPSIRKVGLPVGSTRGGFLTQAAILKITANGTTTSPVPRGAFVMARLLGRPPEPPPPDIPAVEPDVRGAATIREMLDKHRSDSTCSSCHSKIDPVGFALESFDVIGGFRSRYRSIGSGDPAPRGSIDPAIGIAFKLGPAVDPSGELPDGRKFRDISELQSMLVADSRTILFNLASQLTIYATGRAIAFSDRPALIEIVKRTEEKGGGIRTLLHELVKSNLFLIR